VGRISPTTSWLVGVLGVNLGKKRCRRWRGRRFLVRYPLPERENNLLLIFFLVFRINPAFPAFEFIHLISSQCSTLPTAALLPRWMFFSPSSGTSTQSNSRTRRRRGWTRRWRVIEYSSILHRRQSWIAGGTNDGIGRIAVVRGRGGPAPYLG